MTAYYNEIDEYAAAWLRNLIAAGHIAPGEVDTRSIEDVHPSDLQGFTQCHFFAGIGGWSIALRAAGWSDDRPIWTGSCPCQPFSTAGEGAGFADERHLWPHFFHLIGELRPPGILGEQVASKDAEAWIDLVHADMEGVGYTFGCVPFPSASVGAPHIRDRNYWLAHPDGDAGGKGRAHVRGRTAGSDAQSRAGSGGRRMPRRLGNADDARLEGHSGHGGAAGRKGQERPVAEAGISLRLADADGRDASAERPQHGRQQRLHTQDDGAVRGAGSGREHRVVAGLGGGPANGAWRDVDWLLCRDAKWRPVEAGTFPLVDGLPRGVGSGGAVLERLASLAGLDNASLARAKSYRVGALRGYGNAINPEQARVFIEEVMEVV